MRGVDFPALFQSADFAAIQTQKKLLNSYKAYLTLLLLGALSPLLVTGRWGHVVGLSLLLASLALYFYRQQAGWHAKWYRARALAESVKTMSWRYMLRAEPFAAVNASANAEEFRSRLGALLQQNKQIGAHLNFPNQQSEQITPAMRERLTWSFEDARDGYLRDRIVNQLDWYNSKAIANQRAATGFLVAVVVAYAGAIALKVVQIAEPTFAWAPVDFFGVLASGLVGWVEIRRYSELASAYSLTAQEVSIIRSKAEELTSSEELAAFVSDAENAFSREHTQWEARRDH